MALTTSGAIKAYLEGPLAMGGAQLGITVFQDQAPDNRAKPYIVIEPLVVTPDALEDGGAATVREHLTVTVWMDWKNLNATGTPRAEDPTLADRVVKALEGSRLMTQGTGVPPTKVYGVLIHSSGPRILERDANVVHVPIWVEVWRAL